MNDPRCPATARILVPGLTKEIQTGVQCKYTKGHDGDHCGYIGPSMGEHFWPANPPETVPPMYTA